MGRADKAKRRRRFRAGKDAASDHPLPQHPPGYVYLDEEAFGGWYIPDAAGVVSGSVCGSDPRLYPEGAARRILLCAGSDESVPDDGRLAEKERALGELRALCGREYPAVPGVHPPEILRGAPLRAAHRRRQAGDPGSRADGVFCLRGDSGGADRPWK